MDALRQAIYDTLNADGTLTALLSTYGSGGDPTIVDGYYAPEDMELPIIKYSVIADDNNDTKTTTMRIIVVDFEIMTSTADDPVTIAERIRTLLHRVAITVSGWTNLVTEVQGPIEGDFDNFTKTALLSVEFTLTC
jgi:hypothetical protein